MRNEGRQLVGLGKNENEEQELVKDEDEELGKTQTLFLGTIALHTLNPGVG